MAAKEIEVPEWLVPGAKVVVWKDGMYGDQSPEARIDTVRAVGKMWINLENLGEKIRIDTLRSKEFGGEWHHWRYQIDERGAGQAVKMLNRTNMINAKNAAGNAARAWEKDIYNDELRVALRDALDRFGDALNLFRGKS
jgi:hypothetical protein